MSDTVPDLLAALIRSVDAARAERKRSPFECGDCGHCSLPYGHDGEHAETTDERDDDE